ncbi:hypothetical protein HPB50_009853 [Hyalomma asiaticum]|uniref:Uncharacterized protein n=1 Tax=Hyalomma asiaticum TaxID=266040 RepID=A0ACB7TLR6_HYAAI|nr:hypothetical protein HPB50_009853 [Hyalomma asiaticum]
MQFWWKCVLLRLPKEKPQERSNGGGLFALGDTELPAKISDVLKKSPKFALQPKVPARELLSLNQQMAKRMNNNDSERCLLDGVNCLLQTADRSQVHESRGTLGLQKEV